MTIRSTPAILPESDRAKEEEGESRKMKLSRQGKTPNNSRNRITGIFGFLLFIILIFTFTNPVMATPQLPFQLYGNVTINGTPASAGVPVSASIGGTQLFSSVTDASGRYGYEPVFFRIPADDPDTLMVDEGGVNGDIVQMSVAGVAAATTTFASGNITNLNLSIGLPASKLAFITPPRILDIGVVSGVITVQVQDAYNDPVNVGSDIVINLDSSSVTGRFDTLPTGLFDGTITSITVPTGSNSVNFYYLDTTPGRPVITASSTGLASANQTETVNPFTLTVNITGNGIVNKIPDQISYNYGTVVTCTAVPAPGWTFAGWSGDYIGTVNPYDITIDSNKTLTATFTQDQYTLTINVVGNGSVTKNPDQVTYTYGTIVELTANADPGWVFSGWSGDIVSSANPSSVTTNGNRTVTATFTFVSTPQYTLTINTIGNGSVNKVPDQPSYASGTIVTCTAIADPGWTFVGWSGDYIGTTNPYNITMNANKTLTATFTQNQYNLTINVVGNGTVTKDPDQASYTSGTVVTCTAVPDSGWAFAGWSGDYTGTANPYYITMNSDKIITATFTEVQSPYKLVFITPPQTFDVCVVSGIITVQVQDICDNPVDVLVDTLICLSSTSATGRFDVNSTGSFDGNVNCVVISAGANSASFYYIDGTAGTPAITVSSTNLIGASQVETICPGPASKLVFITPAQMFNVCTPSGVITVQVQDNYGNPVNVCANMEVCLYSSSATGVFDTTSTGPFDGTITCVVVPGGSNSVSFFYMDGTAGTPAITVSSTGLTSAAQTQTVCPITPAGGGDGSGSVGGSTTTSEVVLEGLNCSGSLNLDYQGCAQSSQILQSPGTGFSIKIDEGTRLLDVNGNPLSGLSHSQNIGTLPQSPDGRIIIGAHVLGPDGAQFTPGITLVFQYDPASLPVGTQEEQLQVAFWDGARWQFVSGIIDAGANTITIHTTHFTIFAIITQEVSPAPTPTSQPAPTVKPEPTTTLVPVPTSTPEPVTTTTAVPTTTTAITTTNAIMTTTTTGQTPTQTSEVATTGIPPYLIGGIIGGAIILGLLIYYMISKRRAA